MAPKSAEYFAKSAQGFTRWHIKAWGDEMRNFPIGAFKKLQT
jgi:hypothetical protein